MSVVRILVPSLLVLLLPLTFLTQGESVNERPSALAGADQEFSLKLGELRKQVTLDASSCFDTDGSVSSYRWSGPSGAFLGESVILDLAEGTHEFSLVVTDDDGAHSDSAAMKVYIHGPPSLLPAEIDTYDTIDIRGTVYGRGLIEDGTAEKKLPMRIIVPVGLDPTVRLPWYLAIETAGFTRRLFIGGIQRAKRIASAGVVVFVAASRLKGELPVTEGDEKGDSLLSRSLRAHLADTQKAVDWIVANSVTEKYSLNLNWGGSGAFPPGVLRLFCTSPLSLHMTLRMR